VEATEALLVEVGALDNDLLLKSKRMSKIFILFLGRRAN